MTITANAVSKTRPTVPPPADDIESGLRRQCLTKLRAMTGPEQFKLRGRFMNETPGFPRSTRAMLKWRDERGVWSNNLIAQGLVLGLVWEIQAEFKDLIDGVAAARAEEADRLAGLKVGAAPFAITIVPFRQYSADEVEELRRKFMADLVASGDREALIEWLGRNLGTREVYKLVRAPARGIRVTPAEVMVALRVARKALGDLRAERPQAAPIRVQMRSVPAPFGNHRLRRRTREEIAA